MSESENLVLTVAKMIDHEGAYSIAYDGTEPPAKQLPLSTRQKYWQASYEATAVNILKMLSALSKRQINEALIAFEIEGWRRLGVPIDEEGEALVRKKHEARAALSEPPHG